MLRCLLFLAFCGTLFCNPLPGLDQGLQVNLLPPGIIHKREPNWIAHTLSTFPDGKPEAILFYAPEPLSPYDVPVQLVTFRDSGKVQQEVDLTLVPENHAAAKALGTRVVPHGHAVSYFPNGSVATVMAYHEGIAQGPMQTFYPNGTIASLVHYKQGTLEGDFKEYHDNGILAAEGQYNQGRLSGSVTRYHPKEDQKAASTTYVNGIAEGDAFEWYPSGGVESRMFFSQGLLSDNGAAPAVTYFDEDHKVVETQALRAGQAHGPHVRYFVNGQESYRQHYQKGLRVGRECYFDEHGELIGSGEYVQGIPVGEHYRKDPTTGKIVYLAKYDRQGHLLQPIVESYPSGTKKSQYTLANGELEGDYLEYFPNGQTKHHYNYKQGTFDGLQQDFFESGRLKKRANYRLGAREGLYQEWNSNGQLLASYAFSHDLRNGSSEDWYDDGQAKRSAVYVRGELDGPFREWGSDGRLLVTAAYQNGLPDGLWEAYYPSGQLKERAYYSSGRLKGKYETFYENGQRWQLAHYENGQPHGQWTEWFEDGLIETEGRYVAGNPDGEWHVYYPLLPGQEKQQLARLLRYKDGIYDGEQRTYYFDGANQAIIPYASDILHGTKQLWTRAGDLLQETTYEQGRVEGRHYERKTDGQVIIANYKNNRLHGFYQLFYPENEQGKLVKSLEAEYVDGHYEGEVRSYDVDGNKIASTQYHNGLKEGPAAIFSNGGSTIVVATFAKDKKQGPSYEYYPSGALRKHANYVDDVKEGQEISYHENGGLAASAEYVKGQLHGVSKSWTPDGILTFEGHYSHGKKNGEFNKYYDDGTPRVLQVYVNDQLKPGSRKSYPAPAAEKQAV